MTEYVLTAGCIILYLYGAGLVYEMFDDEVLGADNKGLRAFIIIFWPAVFTLYLVDKIRLAVVKVLKKS